MAYMERLGMMTKSPMIWRENYKDVHVFRASVMSLEMVFGATLPHVA